MISQDIEIKATPKQCYKIITDYAKYPDFISDLKSVEVKNKKGNSCDVTYHISVIKDIKYTLRMVGEPGENRIEWSFVSGEMMKDNHGFWQLEEIKKGVTLATYNVEVKFGLLVPSTVTKVLVGKNLPSMLAAFKKRIEASK